MGLLLGRRRGCVRHRLSRQNGRRPHFCSSPVATELSNRQKCGPYTSSAYKGSGQQKPRSNCLRQPQLSRFLPETPMEGTDPTHITSLASLTDNRRRLAMGLESGEIHIHVNALNSPHEWREELVIPSPYVDVITDRVHTLISCCYRIIVSLMSARYIS